MKVFISGGSKSGKSSLAEKLSKKIQKPGAPLYYLATMIPTDKEDESRIIRHQKDREGFGFETVEAGRDIPTATNKCDYNGTYLLDSVTALLANEMFPPGGHVQPYAYKKVTNDLIMFLNQTNDVVIVSDFIYSDAFIYDGLTETYRGGLAYIDKQMAKRCDVVIEAWVGNFITYKGEAYLNEL